MVDQYEEKYTISKVNNSQIMVSFLFYTLWTSFWDFIISDCQVINSANKHFGFSDIEQHVALAVIHLRTLYFDKKIFLVGRTNFARLDTARVKWLAP